MTKEEVYKAIDYYQAHATSYPSLALSGFAALVSLMAIGLSIYTFKKQYKEDIYKYLAEMYNDVLDKCFENPKFVDITVTENYSELMSKDESLKYDIYCYKAWGHVEDIITKKFQKDPQFEPIIRWVASYHHSWIVRNPTFFKIPEFWDIIDEVREQPNLIFSYRQLPTKDGDIDWDVVAQNYHNYILGPFAPEMVNVEPGKNPRNKLLNYLSSLPKEDLAQMAVADHGSGPGNLIPHLAGLVPKITCIDKSEVALRIASKKAAEYGIKFEEKCIDFCTAGTAEKFDLILSANSILPKNRQDVVSCLKIISESLKPLGRFVAILPSFDTTIYLKSLWREHYIKLTGSEEFADKVLRAFDMTKKVDYENFAYADDGHCQQCYHTPATIEKEFAAAGLRLIKQPIKVYYPWELTKRFDYGYFPKAKEEIWDWFVEAERAPCDAAGTLAWQGSDQANHLKHHN